MNEEEKLSALRLIRSENVGTRTFLSLVKAFGSAHKAVQRIYELSNSKKIKLCSREDALTELEKIQSFGADLIYFKDENYPELLKEIPDFPPFITILGKNKALLSRTKVAIVGSRNASMSGMRFAHKISNEIANAGYVTVSGLARGIDACVHKASLTQGTIAVIAGGIDNIYPPEHKQLYQDITNNGLIISENAFGSAPKSQSFPQRNRIISGLSVGTAIIEASLKSGSLITANFALEQNREVFAVPGFPMDARCAGTNKLLKQGAHFLENVEDIIQVINNHAQYSIKQEQTLLQDEPDYDNLEKDLDKIENLLLSKLSSTPASIDDLVRHLKIPVNILMVAIVELELAGKIQRANSEVSLVYL